jgi:hypothetical protein
MAVAANQNFQRDPIVNVMLTGGRVTRSFRDALFSASCREGLTPSEFALKATAEKLSADGVQLPGVFRPGDLKIHEGA